MLTKESSKFDIKRIIIKKKKPWKKQCLQSPGTSLGLVSRGGQETGHFTHKTVK